MAISRLSRYSSSCSKQMYSTLAWPLWAMLRAIWSDIVVLPVPCAPPMSISSPARMPPPRVRSSGEKPSGIGWYSVTTPLLTFSDRPAQDLDRRARVKNEAVCLRDPFVRRPAAPFEAGPIGALGIWRLSLLSVGRRRHDRRRGGGSWQWRGGAA